MVLAIAVVLLAVLGIIGTGVESRLNPTTLNVPGTESSQANELLHEHFGDSAPFAILLQGPAKAIDRQGPQLVRALRRDPNVTTLSPWDRGSVSRLRPSPDRALILADFHVDTKTAVNDTVPELEEILEQQVHSPVRATQSGFATISRAIQDASIAASERGELVALPFLLIILLLVFRSPIAAAIPLAFGAVTVVASRGILYFLTSWFDVDAFALAVCTMMGLALGVDYALLMVSRFREELAAGTEPAEAARRTRRTAGRTTVFAGSTLLLSMLVSLFILPGSLLVSLAGTLIMVVILSVVVATVVGPALLTLLGPNVDRWRIGKPASDRSLLMAFVHAALRRPAPIAALIGAVLLILAAPAVGLKTGPPSPEELAKDAPARQAAELIDRTIGPGWDAPFQVIAVNREGPITDRKSMAALGSFQRKMAALPGVQAVIGPSRVTKRIEPLQKLGNAALTAEGNIGPVKQLGRLGRQLGAVAGGVAQLRDGIAEASAGAGLLALGSDRAGEAAQQFATGLGRATVGSERAIGALEQFAKGSKRLAEAEGTAVNASLQFMLTIRGSLIPNTRNNQLRRSQKLEKALAADAETKLPQLIAPAKEAEAQLKTALAQLQGMTVGQTDPNYAAALDAVRRATAAATGTDPVSGTPYAPEYAGLAVELEALQARLLEDTDEATSIVSFLKSELVLLKRLSNGADKLNEGLRKIHTAGNKLAGGAAKLSRAATNLGDGLSRLAGGTAALVTGIDQLGGGAEALETSLAQGAEEVAPLQGGLEEASVRVLGGKKRINRQARRVRDQSPGLFNSGYFVLSAVDGAPPRARAAAGETIDLNSGQAASILVISKYTFNSSGSIALNKTLEGNASELADEADLETGVGGGAAQLNDYGNITTERIPFVIAAITLVTFLVLVLILRAIPLAAIAVGLNLLTVGVAFGVLTLLFHVPHDWPLGGHSYVETVGAMMIFAVVFGLSIDYAVFLLSRMREHYDREGDHAAAIEFGLSKTAAVITGAAAIMMAVFIAFAGASIATVSQLGVGLTVAVILDATVVRIVLLPALMLLIGDRVWWLPRPLARVIPKLSV
ncbi:MAG: putative drug exporter of the superfamily [Solirubrobacterales bacterium]|nr:putative drug exporter of the superfamily [Solirubrobacterales bacterium]